MADVAGVEQRWTAYLRRGPHGMLAAGAVLSLATADPVGMTTAERYTALVLTGAAVVLQLWFGRWSRDRPPAPSAAGTRYYFARWALGFALSWCNPFFAFYAAAGYLGPDRLLRGRALKAGPVATAVVVAGSQAGGMPLRGPSAWLLFGGLLCVHLALLAVFGQLAAREEERNRLQTATIAELERTNAALRRALDENAALHTQLLARAREAGVADERRRLAAEIHDTLAQDLTGIIAQLQVVANTPDPGRARAHVLRATDLARHSLGEARRSVHNLAPMALADAGLPEALRKTVGEWGERTGVRAEFTVTGTAEQLHGEVAATLLRIVQEALSNTARHADAARAGVTLSFLGEEVILDIRDDGRGFDRAATGERTGTGGFGLPGMSARAERIAGSLTVESEPGLGTAVCARVPLVRHD
ncbi:sensor histidine kinase [Streptomyces sp. NPDC058735]|uniref:sensor histidine kinase n=1 Tax=unclassified Streptomyces TaxID=2593676 RepID=UPI003694DABC